MTELADGWWLVVVLEKTSGDYMHKLCDRSLFVCGSVCPCGALRVTLLRFRFHHEVGARWLRIGV